MATTINSYSVALGLNTQGVIDGSKLARKEVRELTKIFQEQENDMEKYAKKLDVLERAYKSGAIQQDAYEESVKRLNEKFRDTKDIDKHKTAINSASTSLTTYATRAIAAYVSLQTLSAGFRNIINRIDEVDSLAEKATGLDESVGRIQSYQFALKKLAGIEGPQALNLLEQMTRRIGDNELGTGKSAEALARLGVTLDELKGKSPIDQFEMLAGEIQKIESRTEKSAIANKLFGTSASELMPILMSTQQEYESLLIAAEKFGLSLKDTDVSKLQSAQDSLDDMYSSLNGMANVLTVEFAQTIADVAESVSGIADDMRTIAGLVKTIGGFFGGSIKSFTPMGWIDKEGIEQQLERAKTQRRLNWADRIQDGNLNEATVLQSRFDWSDRLQKMEREEQRRRQSEVKPIEHEKPGSALENKEATQQLKELTTQQARLGQAQLEMQSETNRRLAELEFAKRIR